MSKLPVVSGREVVKALEKAGYYVRGRESSHIHLRHPSRKPLTIPDHKEIARARDVKGDYSSFGFNSRRIWKTTLD